MLWFLWFNLNAFNANSAYMAHVNIMYCCFLSFCVLLRGNRANSIKLMIKLSKQSKKLKRKQTEINWKKEINYNEICFSIWTFIQSIHNNIMMLYWELMRCGLWATAICNEMMFVGISPSLFHLYLIIPHCHAYVSRDSFAIHRIWICSSFKGFCIQFAWRIRSFHPKKSLLNKERKRKWRNKSGENKENEINFVVPARHVTLYHLMEIACRNLEELKHLFPPITGDYYYHCCSYYDTIFDVSPTK